MLATHKHLPCCSPKKHLIWSRVPAGCLQASALHVTAAVAWVSGWKGVQVACILTTCILGGVYDNMIMPLFCLLQSSLMLFQCSSAQCFASYCSLLYTCLQYTCQQEILINVVCDVLFRRRFLQNHVLNNSNHKRSSVSSSGNNKNDNGASSDIDNNHSVVQ